MGGRFECRSLGFMPESDADNLHDVRSYVELPVSDISPLGTLGDTRHQLLQMCVQQAHRGGERTDWISLSSPRSHRRTHICSWGLGRASIRPMLDSKAQQHIHSLELHPCRAMYLASPTADNERNCTELFYAASISSSAAPEPRSPSRGSHTSYRPRRQRGCAMPADRSTLALTSHRLHLLSSLPAAS